MDKLLEQEKRTARAREALAQSTIRIERLGAEWRVVNGDDHLYRVGHDGDHWHCTCPDYEHTCQSHDLRCKHIEAVRLTLEADTNRKERTTMENTNTVCGWAKVYHPSGLQVTIPLPVETSLTAANAKAMLDSVSTLLTVGFLVNAPGLEDGEKVETIVGVVRRAKANDDASETPVIDLYPDRANFRILGIYLNTEQDIQAFEKAAGVKLSELPLYDGDNAIERGKGAKTDKYVIALKQPAKVVFKANPKWEGDEDKKHPKRVFVRWASQSTEAAAASSTSAAATPAANNGNGNGNGDKVMTLDEALKVTTPKGTPLSELDETQLAQIAAFQKKNMDADTAKLKVAAAIVFDARKNAIKA